jgi:hypothetical protein
MMKRRELKQKAQDLLLLATTTAFIRLIDDDTLTHNERHELYAEMDKQLIRVEKLFNYEPGSWLRG